MDKQTQRKAVQHRLEQETPATLSGWNVALTQKALPYLEGKKRVACYVSTALEPDTHGILDTCFRKGIEVVVPQWDTQGHMDFVPIHGWEDLREEPSGYWVPISGKPVNPKKIDLVFVPLMAFDWRRGRIGKGGGYYDRWLPSTSAQKVGLAYHCMEFETVKQDPWDVPMDVILTE